jgi:cell division protein ZapB
MTDHYFAALEQKLDELIKRLNQLKEQNRQLRSKNAKLEEERAQLVQSNDSTRAQVEAMLTRLKTLEKTK